ncbi:unnamed protein product, partial [Chrysoparadoxa australica]
GYQIYEAKVAALPVSELSIWPRKGEKRRAVVIGAGVVGVSCAYQLARAGYSVTVLDKGKGPGTECSAVAAGGMQRSNPLVSRESWKDVAQSFSGTGSYNFFHIKWLHSLTNPHFLRWIGEFSYYSLMSPPDQAKRQNHMLMFTDWAITELMTLLEDKNLSKKCGLTRTGAMMLSYEKGKRASPQLTRFFVIPLPSLLE